MFSGALSIVVLVAFMATRPCPGWWHLRTPGRLIMTVMKLRTRDETIADTARSLRSARSARCQMQVVDRRRKASFQYRPSPAYMRATLDLPIPAKFRATNSG
ncbi:hypothetical protein J3458_020063 [Metarhizium acridum]|uniref:uncharacterized protein n=1 Tax=Metarhizium acridum TaxID=92637 RepID=UPI001C6C563F|nr:hypothetical protein J3458_020063 [Metarhizium acridum]